MERYITAPDLASQHHRSKLFESISNSSKRTKDIHEPLKLHLLVHNPASDSPLTPSWDIIPDALELRFDISKTALLDTLRDYLPVRALPPIISLPIFPRRGGVGRRGRPRLAAATLYITYQGLVVPLESDEADWHYKNVVSTSELLDRTEAEWSILKELMGASGELACFVSVKGGSITST